MKVTYVSPSMDLTQIETESNFAGSVVDDKGEGITVKSNSQQYSQFDCASGNNAESDAIISWE